MNFRKIIIVERLHRFESLGWTEQELKPGSFSRSPFQKNANRWMGIFSWACTRMTVNLRDEILKSELRNVTMDFSRSLRCKKFWTTAGCRAVIVVGGRLVPFMLKDKNGSVQPRNIYLLDKGLPRKFAEQHLNLLPL